MRYAAGIAILIAASMACSRNPQQMAAASPAGPTARAATASLLVGDIGGVSGKLDASFPSRTDLFLFTSNADDKYRAMGRTPSSFYIDREGVAVWMQEYIRYRVNGCDHATALRNVQAQIAGGAAPATCGSVPDGVINLPSRADSYAALQAFNTQYQGMGRGITLLYIDLEGAAIWIQEYLRYRLNACDAATAQQKVFTQIDGGPIAATCFVACNYVLSPSALDPAAGAVSSSFEIRPIGTPTDFRSCGWTASSDASWLTIPNDYRSGNGYTIIPYTVARNDGGDRRGSIRFAWLGGGTSFIVNQVGSPFVTNVSMVDPGAGPEDTTQCRIRTASTPCRFTANTNLPGNNYQYSWQAVYSYGVDKNQTQSGGSNVFQFTEQCGGSGSTAAGTPANLTLYLTITDDRGNTVSVQRNLTIVFFTC